MYILYPHTKENEKLTMCQFIILYNKLSINAYSWIMVYHVIIIWWNFVQSQFQSITNF